MLRFHNFAKSTYGKMLIGLIVGVALGMVVLGFINSQPITAAEVRSEYAKDQAVIPEPEDVDNKIVTANNLYRSSDYNEALQLLGPLALKGYAKAQYLVGVMYFFGHGVPKDPQEAASWWKLAANEYPEAKFQLAMRYSSGTGVPQDQREARRLGLEAAKSGHVASQGMVGIMMVLGEGGEEDIEEGARWVRQAAANGEPIAQKFLMTALPDILAKRRLATLLQLNPRLTVAQAAALMGTENFPVGDDPSATVIASGIRTRTMPVVDPAPAYNPQPRIRMGAIESADEENAYERLERRFGASSSSRRSIPAVSDAAPTPPRSTSPSNVGAINPRTGEFYAPSGSGFTSTRDGTYYAPAGPNGVVDTRTGQFIPVTH
ncbi:tetratricopeptide repeat protein [Sphingobium mellinum]|uniref:tetratricopeptide repeat protein n=1 Tax=Sphingobium mellinum TaxID=1387166 RepID=UPI0030EC8736